MARFIALFFLIAALSVARTAAAWQCVDNTEKDFAEAKAVIIGQVVSNTGQSCGARISTVAVINTFKGSAEEEIKVASGDHCTMRGYALDRGEVYLLFLYNNNADGYSVWACRGTEKLEDVKPEKLQQIKLLMQKQ